MAEVDVRTQCEAGGHWPASGWLDEDLGRVGQVDCLCGLARYRLELARVARSWEEVRVTGVPEEGYPDYDFVFGRDGRPLGAPFDAMTAATEFVDKINKCGTWRQAPVLHRRTVTETEWELVV